MKKNRRGMPQPNQFKQYFTVGLINLFRKYPSNPKFDPPLKIPGHGPGNAYTLHEKDVDL